MKKYSHEASFVYEGKRYRVRGNSEKEVIEKIALKKRDLEEGKITISSSMTVAQWTDKCMKVYKPNLSAEYRSEMMARINKHILSEIGNLPVRSVKPLQCQAILYNQADMSKSHITKLHQELRFIFSKAVENGLILSSPAEHLERPKGTQGKRRSLTETERKHLLKVADNDSTFNLFLMMLYCGCRPAEAMELQGRDIQKLQDVNVLHIRGTKTENADRYVPLPDVMYEKIKNTF